ncbi:MAG: class I SAM-dependent methyltransferase [Desulfovibrionaceae bacterium]|nr:class I SAM-dependent methyltransferase [Desulfovibrionaceae bacterium]
MESRFFSYLRDRWPFSHAVQVRNIERLVHLCEAEPWHIYAIKSRIWRRHVCIACNWVADCTRPDECVFEPGCGSGANLLWLAQKKGFSNLRGSDISEKAVRLCKMLAAQSGVPITIIQDDSLSPAHLPSNVDTILSVNWLYHQPGASMAGFLDTHRDCLKKNGKIVCDIIDAAYNTCADNQYHSDDLKLPPSKRRTTRYLIRYSLGDMKQIAKNNGFRVLRHTRLHASIPRAVYMLERV